MMDISSLNNNISQHFNRIAWLPRKQTTETAAPPVPHFFRFLDPFLSAINSQSGPNDDD